MTGRKSSQVIVSVYKIQMEKKKIPLKPITVEIGLFRVHVAILLCLLKIDDLFLLNMVSY